MFVIKFSEIQITEKNIIFWTAERLKGQDGKENFHQIKIFVQGRGNFVILALEGES